MFKNLHIMLFCVMFLSCCQPADSSTGTSESTTPPTSQTVDPSVEAGSHSAPGESSGNGYTWMDCSASPELIDYNNDLQGLPLECEADLIDEGRPGPDDAEFEGFGEFDNYIEIVPE